MHFLKRLFDFYINSSIHVALAVCSLCLITLFEFGFEPDTALLFFVFFASITGYNFVKYFGLAKFHHRRLSNWLRYIQIFSFFCFLGMCFYAIKLPVKTLVYLGGLGIITFLYAIPFLPKRLFLDQAQNLRAISGLKVYIIAFVWAVVTVVIPLIHEGMLMTFDLMITSVQRFLFVLALMLPFEIRDMQFDSLKLSTIPQQIGVERTKYIGVLLMLVFFLMEFFKDDFTEAKAVITLVTSIIVSLVVVLSHIKQPKYYSSFFVEGIPMAWLAMVVFFG